MAIVFLASRCLTGAQGMGNVPLRDSEPFGAVSIALLSRYALEIFDEPSGPRDL